ncbi:MAG: HAD family phosphatase [Bacteroidota bacterium]
MSAFGILFDMDGVLVDTNPTHNEALIRLFDRYQIPYDQDALNRRAHGRPNSEWIPDFMGVTTQAEIQQIADEKESLFRELYKGRLKALNGLLPLLDLLQLYDIKMAVATSAPIENANFILDGLSLRAYFQAVLHAGDVTLGKPHPQIYQKAAAALGLAAKDCIVIEDSIVGVQSGLAAGAKVIGVTTTHSAAELKAQGTSMIIKDFFELGMDQLIGVMGTDDSN